ncbi:MAG: hypothetical protein PHI40_07690 [Caldisericia bacterium]|nr:hypothetical protein [Caldisericia bacterium]
MAGFSDYLEQALLNATLRATAYTSPAKVYISLHTADPTDDGSVGEVSTVDTGYARQEIAFSAPTSDGTGYKCVNSAEVTFGDPTGPWGAGQPITHLGLWDAATEGHCLYTLPDTNVTPKSYGINDVCVIRAGSVSVKLD